MLSICKRIFGNATPFTPTDKLANALGALHETLDAVKGARNELSVERANLLISLDAVSTAFTQSNKVAANLTTLLGE